ncbi:PREDICTED: protein CASC1 isoform X2 [Chinchilla lanigera]|uniref:protein CASC1 isoform X2 n=1 Tax=Chinchilla lanigera TaxID=34839 RepID=UPI000695F8A0|nr:PREDICTED: protein CASC1 isoform X2 [Chinchilla lanigera]
MKKKITKAEQLKQLQEEEEKRLKEEEEARLKSEKEEQERLEKQRIEKEKWQQLEKKDLQRRPEELEELYSLEECFPKAEKLKQDTRSLSQWKHYIQCDGSPDPSIPQEMNTFISLWKEETNQTFETVIKKSKLVLQLIEKLKLMLLETPTYNLRDKNIIQYEGSILELQELLHLKFNIATEILLRQASTLADLDTGNMEKIIQDENVTLYVWANLKKNPRYKSVKFSNTQIGFEIPKILATSDVALRLLHTHYDHITPLHAVRAPLVPLVPLVPCVPAGAELSKREVKSTTEAVGQEDQEVYKPQERGSVFIQEGEIKAEEQNDPEVQMTSVKKESKATEVELEMKLLSESVAEAQLDLIKNAPEKPEVSENKEVDLCQFTILGGVYHLDILELPPQCKPVKGWMMVEILKEGLQKFTYPPEITEDFDTENAFPPIEVTLQVHEKVTFFEEPVVARWNAQGKYWQTDGISGVYYTPEERLISFSLETFGPITLMQDTHINMPYQSWELRPLDENKVLLTVTTVFTEIQIQIQENLCMLSSVKIKDKEHSSALEGKWMTPIPFISALKETGLNIFPTAYSHFYVVINNKVPLVEMKAYRQMALLSSAFAFGWSKWNTLCNSTNVVFKVREHLSDEHTETPNWELYMFSGDRAWRLKIEEESESFSEALGEKTEFHSTLFHMVKDFASKEAIEKVRRSSCQFIDSVCYLLLSTRVLSYS